MSAPTTVAEDVAILDEVDSAVIPDEEESEVEEDTPEEEDSDEEEGEPETEDSDEEEAESDEAEDLLANRPTYRELKERYPKIFKEVPELKEVLFREQKYSELFPSMQEASSAKEDVEAFRVIQTGIINNNPDSLFESIKEAGKLKEFASTIFESINKVDSDAGWEIAGPILQDAVRYVYNEALKDKDENLKISVLNFTKKFLGDVEIAKGTKSIVSTKTEKVNPEKEQLSKERNEYQQEKYKDLYTDVAGSGESQLKKLITGKLDNGKSSIDPDGSMSEFMRSSLTNEVIKRVSAQLQADKAHMANMNSLWERAKKDGYSRAAWKDKIVNTFLARAKSLVPKVRAAVLSEALGKTPGKTAALKQADKVTQLKSRREPGNSGRPGSGKSVDKYNPRNVNYRQTSDEDILNDDIKYKG